MFIFIKIKGEVLFSILHIRLYNITTGEDLLEFENELFRKPFILCPTVKLKRGLIGSKEGKTRLSVAINSSLIVL